MVCVIFSVKSETNLYGLEDPKKPFFAKVFPIYNNWTFLKMSIFQTSLKLLKNSKNWIFYIKNFETIYAAKIDKTQNAIFEFL
jgi:hypothetical protein